MTSKPCRRTGSRTWQSRNTLGTALSLATALLVGGGCEDDPDLAITDAAVRDAAGDGPVVDAGDAPGSETGAQPDAGDTGPVTTSSLTILHTNDLHSHLQGHGAEADYTPATTGDDMPRWVASPGWPPPSGPTRPWPWPAATTCCWSTAATS